ncbi:hypothetical protein MTO96_000912 [Rhipicephalus appendiculatus]
MSADGLETLGIWHSRSDPMLVALSHNSAACCWNQDNCWDSIQDSAEQEAAVTRDRCRHLGGPQEPLQLLFHSHKLRRSQWIGECKKAPQDAAVAKSEDS